MPVPVVPEPAGGHSRHPQQPCCQRSGDLIGTTPAFGQFHAPSRQHDRAQQQRLSCGERRSHRRLPMMAFRSRSSRRWVHGSSKSAREATAKALRQEPKPLVHIPRPSRQTTRQQRQRTGTAANSYIPQGDRWFSIELGRRSVRCRPISCRHCRATWHRRLSSNSCNSRRRVLKGG